MFGLDAEVSFEARNLTGENYEEYQRLGDGRIETNTFDVGRSLSLGLSLTF